jgi:hypothetical protein
MPNVDRARLPRVPPNVHTLLRNVAPGTAIKLERMAEQGQRYAALEGVSIEAHATTTGTIKLVVEAVTESVHADGAAYFRVQPKNGRQQQWYAFIGEDTEAELEDPYTDASIPDGAMVPAWMLKLHIQSYFALTHRVESLLDTGISMLEQSRDDHAASMAAMQNSLTASSEATMRAIELEHRKEILALGMEGLEMLTQRGRSDSKTIMGILTNVQRLMDPSDFDALRNHELGKALWDTTTLGAFKERAQAIYDAVMKGLLKFSANTMSNLGPYLSKVAGTVGEGGES